MSECQNGFSTSHFVIRNFIPRMFSSFFFTYLNKLGSGLIGMYEKARYEVCLIKVASMQISANNASMYRNCPFERRGTFVTYYGVS